MVIQDGKQWCPSFLKYLYSYPVLIHGQDLASGVSVQLWQQNAEGGSIASEGLVRDEVVWNVLSPQLHSCLACRQGICLCKEVAHQLIVVGHHLSLQVTSSINQSTFLVFRTHQGSQQTMAGRLVRMLSSNDTLNAVISQGT